MTIKYLVMTAALLSAFSANSQSSNLDSKIIDEITRIAHARCAEELERHTDFALVIAGKGKIVYKIVGEKRGDLNGSFIYNDDDWHAHVLKHIVARMTDESKCVTEDVDFLKSGYVKSTADDTPSVGTNKNKRPVTEFTIVGVQHGDTEEQAISAVTDYFSIDKDDLELSTNSSGDIVYGFEYRTDGIKVTVIFRPVKNSSGEETNIVGSVYVDWENVDAYAVKIIEESKKFGPPSFKRGWGTEGERLVWCETVNAANDKCILGNLYINLDISSDKGRVKIDYNG